MAVAPDQTGASAVPGKGVRVRPRVNPVVRNLFRFWFWLQRPFLLPRVRRTCLEYVQGTPLLILPEVLNAVVFRGGAFLAATIAAAGDAAPRGTPDLPRALDMGTGSGVGAIFAARSGYRVIGVDINPRAVRCARINVLLNELEDRIEIREGDLFSPLQGELFDLVLFNPPFFRGDPRNLFDMAWRSRDVVERFVDGLPGVLAPGGRALILLSTDGDAGSMLDRLEGCGFDLAVEARKHFGNEIMTVYSASPGSAR